MGKVGGSADMAALHIDARYSCSVGIDIAHHYLHHGGAFKASAADSTLGIGETLIVAFRTANSVRHTHMKIAFLAPLSGVMEIWEGPTWAQGTGVQTPAVNKRRGHGWDISEIMENSAAPAWAPGNVLVNPTGLSTAGAELLHSSLTWGSMGAGPTKDGNSEFLLACCATYALRFTSAVANNGAQIHLNWWEHLDYELVEL